MKTENTFEQQLLDFLTDNGFILLHSDTSKMIKPSNDFDGKNFEVVEWNQVGGKGYIKLKSAIKSASKP